MLVLALEARGEGGVRAAVLGWWGGGGAVATPNHIPQSGLVRLFPGLEGLDMTLGPASSAGQDTLCKGHTCPVTHSSRRLTAAGP